MALRFAVGADAMARLRRLALFAGIPPIRRSLTSIYYDTPDLGLKHRGLALRIRKEGRVYLQTVRTAQAGDPIGGDERHWQATLPHAVPNVTLPELQDWLGDLDMQGLEPVFASRIRRTIRQVRPFPGTLVEVAFDQGLLAMPGGAELTISEINLYLKQGDANGLFEVARCLHQSADLRLEPRSLAIRGYALLAEPGGRLNATPRHGRVDLHRDLPVEEALEIIVRRCLSHLLVNDPATRLGDAEGVHQMRVALRRLRVAFNLFKSLIPPDQLAWAVSEVKWLADALGAARNWDVFADLVEPVGQAFAGDQDIALLSRTVAEARETARATIDTVLSSRRYAEFTLELTAWIETQAWRRQRVSEASVRLLSPLGELADQLLDRRYRAARKLARRFGELDIDGRHELRIALKKMRYAADSFAGLYAGKAVDRYVKRLAALQHDLGLLNDIATADKLIAAFPAAGLGDAGTADLRRGAALVRGWSAHVAAQRGPTLDKELCGFLKAKPFWQRPVRTPDEGRLKLLRGP